MVKTLFTGMIAVIMLITLPLISAQDSASTLPVDDYDHDGTIDAVRYSEAAISIFSGQTNALLFQFVPGAQHPPLPQKIPAASASSQQLASASPMIPQPLFSLAVVPNLFSNDISIIDTKLNQEVARIPVGQRPRYVAMSGNGQYAYVASSTMGEIYKINLVSLTHESTINLPVTTSLAEIEISSNDRWLVAADVYRGTVFIIDTTTDSLQKTMQLCRSCASSLSLVTVAFSRDSLYAYVTETQQQKVYSIYLPTQTITNEYPVQNTGGTPIIDAKVLHASDTLMTASSYCPSYSCMVRKYLLPQGAFNDMITSMSRPIPDIEVIGQDTALASGNICYGTCGGYLDIVNLTTSQVTSVPSSMSEKHLTYDPKTNTLWSLCLHSVIDNPQYYCDPFTINTDRIDVFDMRLMQKRASIPVSITFGFPSLSQDGKFFYAIDYANNAIQVINTTSYAASSIPVGNNPRGIYMQGNNAVKEYVA